MHSALSIYLSAYNVNGNMLISDLQFNAIESVHIITLEEMFGFALSSNSNCSTNGEIYQ